MCWNSVRKPGVPVCAGMTRHDRPACIHMQTIESNKSRHVELILRQIESLPTLPVVATRLLQLTASEDSHTRQVIELVSHDPALTAKVLALCKQAHRGVRSETLTVDKAVMLLGFSAVRNAVLSVKVIEVFNSLDAKHADIAMAGAVEQQIRFDRVSFWRHSLAVATAAELIAKAHPGSKLDPGEAFVCGLLHDIGKLSLDHILPRSYSRVLELVELNQGDIADYERRIIGLDHHMAGKRMAEQWQLPEMIQDCIWLHGSAYDTLPSLEHKRMVGLISLADLVARNQHIGYSGNASFALDVASMAESVDLDVNAVNDVAASLHEQVQQRSGVLHLDDEPSTELFLESIQQANQVLGRMNRAMERRAQAAAAQARTLESIMQFHAEAGAAATVQDVLDTVVASAMQSFGEGFYGILYEGASSSMEGRQWLICQYNMEGRAFRTAYADPPPHTPHLAQLDASQPMTMNLMGILPWISDYLVDAPDLRSVKLLPLNCNGPASAVLLHDRPNLPPHPQLGAILATWGAAVTAASRHESARRLGEELAETNRALAAAKDRLLQTESLTRLGEMAAGAAHEMNNPLAVIVGRSQLLGMALKPGSEQHKSVRLIAEQAHRLSNLITGLRLFADPPKPNKRSVAVDSLLDRVVRKVRSKLTSREADTMIDLQIKSSLPSLSIDADQISDAVTEILCNAVQAQPKTSVNVSARVDEKTNRLLIIVEDDGIGMDGHTLSHAFDPFFSAKSAGRRVGMGLTRAQQYVSHHGGTLELRSVLGKNTVAIVALPLEWNG